MVNFAELIANIENQVRSGNLAQAREALERCKRLQIPREYAVSFGNLARRIGDSMWGLRILRPIVRSTVPLRPAPKIEEYAIYAALLLKVGAIDEAVVILQSHLRSGHPDVLRYLAYAHISVWDYAKAIPLFRKYLQRENEDSYQRCIARVNLAAALVFIEDKLEAATLLHELLNECREKKWDLLYNNCLEISAQHCIQIGDYTLAETRLTEVQDKIASQNRYILFVEKWRAVLQLLKSPANAQSLEALEVVRRRSFETADWETFRDCDFRQGLLLDNDDLLERVRFGTSFPAYKNRIVRVLRERKKKLDVSYLWVLHAEANNPLCVFDLALAREVGRAGKKLKAGQMIHRLLLILCSDFYRPFFVAQIFSKLFPGEHFNPESSPARVFQAFKKTRQWFEKSGIPLEIQVKDGQYWLTAKAPYAIRVFRSEKRAARGTPWNLDSQLQLLQRTWPYQSFTAKQAANLLQVSPSTVREILRAGLDSKKIFAGGRGPTRAYFFKGR